MLHEKERVSEASIVSRLRRKLEAWLDKKKWTHTNLLDWLKGYELPAVGHTEEPYIWLLRALSNSDKTHRQKMASRLAAFLNNERPYQYINGKYDDEFLYNLFYLCSGLQCPDELSEPLYQVADFLEQHIEKQDLFIKSNRYNLSGALRDALIINQTDTHFQEIWRQMLNGRPHHFLQGNRYTGFEGLLFMRYSEIKHDKPAVEQIGWALAKMAEYLDEDKQRRITFCRLLERVKEAWPEYRTWDEEMLFLAIKYKWPRWAILRLNTLVAPLSKWTDERDHFLIWEFYLPYLNNFDGKFWEKTNAFLDNTIIEVHLDQQPSNLLNAIYHCVENARLNCPSDNYRTTRLVADEALKNLREEWLHLKKEWGEPEKDSIFYRFLCQGRIETLVASQPREKQENVRDFLRAAAASAG